tara:strand:- start:405 stop:545 length:141 start_codon:yes stop_codon:yes gene_type:complete
VQRNLGPDDQMPFGFGYSDVKALAPENSVSPQAAPGSSLQAADLLP